MGASAHYSMSSLTSVASGISQCSDFGQESQLPFEDDDEPDLIHNAHSKGGCPSVDIGDSMYGDHDQKEQSLDDLDLDEMMTSMKAMGQLMQRRNSELKQLNQSIKAMELEQQTLKAENQCLRTKRGGPISQNDYRQHIGFWDGDLKRTVQGIDVVPIYNLNNAGYICVGVPVAAHSMYHHHHYHTYIPPHTWQRTPRPM